MARPIPALSVIIGTMAKSPIPAELSSFVVPITDVKLWPKNPRRGDVGMISESLRRFGQVKPILVQKSTMQIVSGNHVYRAAASLGWTEVAAIVMDMPDKQAKAYLAADNRAAELGDFDDVSLASLLAEIARTDTLDGTGYDLEDLEALLAKVGTGVSGGQGDPDAGKPIPDEPWVKDGQIFFLGEHRLGCGEPTDQFLDKLLDGTKIDLLIVTPTGDSRDFDPRNLAAYFGLVPEQFWFRAEGYLDKLAKPGAGGWLVWDKGADAFDGQFGDAFDLIWSKAEHKRDILRHTMIGLADGEKHGGPDFAERPTSLWMALYERYSGFEAVVCDPVAVGGTTLLAAHKTARRWVGAKSEPAYVQALLEKYAEFAGMSVDDIKSASKGMA